MPKGSRDSSLLCPALGNERTLPVRNAQRASAPGKGLVIIHSLLVFCLSWREPGHSVRDGPPSPHHKLRQYLSLIGEEGKVDLFQCLHHLRQARAAQFTEQGLRACWVGRERPSDQCSVIKRPTSAQQPTPWLASLTVGEEDMCCFVGEGWCPLEVCNQGLN